MSDKNGAGPLLYIHQPFAKAPDSSMQEIYITKSEKVKAREDSMDAQIDNTFGIDEETSESSHRQEEKTKEKSQPGFNRVKSFKEMDLKERLDYLANFPKVLPPVPCVFYTQDTNYQGYLIGYEQDQVTIQFHDQTIKTFAVDELKEVIMIGIKR